MVVSLGALHACMLSRDGRAFCWGANESGQVGTNALDEPRPVRVAGLGDVRFSRVSAGSKESCALTVEGLAYCWGNNDHGQLGDGMTRGRSSLAPVIGVPVP